MPNFNNPVQSVIGHDTNKLLAHKMIAELCVEIALGIYEYYAKHNNKWYAKNKGPKKIKAFVEKCAPTLREEAVQQMAMMLARDDIDETWKLAATEAIILHKSLHPAASASGPVYN